MRRLSTRKVQAVVAFIQTHRPLLIRSRRLIGEDRSVERIELQGLTYGEVDLFSFLKILRTSQARDNQVFVDLVSHPPLPA